MVSRAECAKCGEVFGSTVGELLLGSVAQFCRLAVVGDGSASCDQLAYPPCIDYDSELAT